VILAFLALAWLLGIATAAYTGGDTAAVVAAAGLLGAITFALRPTPACLLAIAIAVPLLGLATWRYQETAPVIRPDAIQYRNGDEVRFRAMVDAEPGENQTTTSYRVRVQQIWDNGAWRDASGSVLMTSRPLPAFEYGDLLDVTGALEDPPVIEDFDYREYLARRGIGSTIAYPEAHLIASGQGNPVRAAIIDVRADLTSSLEEALPQPEASLAAGILLGARQSLPPSLRDDMDATGTSHLVAVSGQNITILAAAVIALLAWIIGRRPACWIALGSIVAYAAFVGAEPSVVRAGLMGSIFVLSIAFGRQNSAWIALLLAAAIMTALSPRIVHEVSFQLSFAAVLGLIVLTGPLRERLDAASDRLPAFRDFPLTRPATDLLVLSLASIAFTLPITAVNFHQVSLVAPFANLFAVPAFVPVAATAGAVSATGLMSPGIADALAWFAWLPAAYMISVIEWFATLPLTSLRVESFSVPHAVVYYALLAAFVVWLRRPILRIPEAPHLLPVPRRGLSVAALALVLGLSSIAAWLALTAPASSNLSVTVLDVGEGDAILIEAPSGNRALIDGGPSGNVLASALGRNVPFYDRRIDLVAATHPQSDHVGGLPSLLDSYDVAAILDTSAEPTSEAGTTWRGAAASSNALLLIARRGQSFDLGDGVTLSVIAAEIPSAEAGANLNDSSVVLRLQYGSFAMLLTGDLGEAGEHAVVETGTSLRSTVLKIGHHGSRTSTSERFLDLVDPSVALISVGADNRFGHPAPDVLDRLAGQSVYRTDESGDIRLTTDGDSVWISTQR
jgi:competence protein ComEC